MSSVRSMNGINNIEVNEVEFPDGSTITSAQNLVQLDTNNNFTSNNTFNVNLPTSDVNPELENINNNTMLNKHSADKLYIGNDEISECFNGASITGRDITLTRIDGENAEVIAIPETSLSTCVLKTNVTQEIDGEKTFVEIPKIKIPDGGTLPTPTDIAELTTKNYVDTTAVLKTTAQEIDGIKTFVDIPKIKIPTGGTLPTPTDNAELTTKNYVDTTAVLKSTAQEIDGIKTFVDIPKIKIPTGGTLPTPTDNAELATKKYVDDNGGTGDAVLDGGTEASPQTFTGFNEFENTTKFETTRPQFVSGQTTSNPTDYEFITKADGVDLFGSVTGNAQLDGGVSIGEPQEFTEFNKFSNQTEFEDILVKKTTNQNVNFNMNSQVGNIFYQYSSYTNTQSGGTTNIFYQLGGIANQISQGTTPLGNEILQNGSNSEFGTDGIIRLGGSAPSNLPSTFILKCRGGMYIDGNRGFRIPRRGLYDNNAGLREWLINHNISSGVGTGALNFLYSTNANNGNGSFITRARLNANGNLQLDANLQQNYNFSDARLKSNNIYLENATESLLKLSVQTYDKTKMSNFNLEEKTDKTIRETGLIAQEVYYNAREFRHLVNCGTEYNDDIDLSGNEIGDGKPEGTEIIPDEMDLSGVGIGEKPDYEGAGWSKTASASIEYQGFIAYLIKSNQELHERILKLEEKINI